MEKIQRRFLYRRFIRNVLASGPLFDELNSFVIIPKESLNIFYDENDSNDFQFEKLKKKLMSLCNMRKINDLLKTLYRYHNVGTDIAFKLNSRSFLSSWMIVSFPEYVLGKKLNDIVDNNMYPNDIFFMTKGFISSLNNLMKNPYDNEITRKFFKMFNQFSNAISYFLNRDRAELLNGLIKEYYDINETINNVIKSPKYKYDDETREGILESINSSKTIIIQHIKTLDPTVNENELDLYSKLSILKSEKTTDSQYEILLNDIRSKKLIYLNKVIYELKENLINLNARRTSTGFNIDEILDVELINRCIVYNSSFSKNDVVTYGDYMIKIINELESPVNVETTCNNWDSLKKNNEIDTYELLTKMLFLILTEIRDIKETIMNIATLSSVGINVMNL